MHFSALSSSATYTRLAVPLGILLEPTVLGQCYDIEKGQCASVPESPDKVAGIAVRTCYADLKGSILEEHLTDPMYFAKVKYID